MRRFAGLELGDDAIPDETTILNFRHLLERHELTRAIFEAINSYLRERGILLREGTLVDATLIDAPSSTKNKQGARDPETSSTKKGNDWYFGMKAHVGVDIGSGVVHTLETSTAKVHDSQKFDDLLHGDEQAVFGELPGVAPPVRATAGDGYVSGEREEAFRAQGKLRGVMRKAPKGGKLHPIDERINRIIASLRAKVEHPFRVMKCQFGYRKTRYRGLAKNEAQLFSLFGLGNLFLVQRRLMA